MISLMDQAIKLIPDCWIHNYSFGRAVIRGRGEDVAPVYGCETVGVLLQRETC